MVKVSLVNQPLVLISQVQRSGGTLLTRLFDGHPQVFAHPHELQWGFPTKTDWPNDQICKITQRNFAPQIKQLIQPWLLFASLEDSYSKADGNTKADKSEFDFDLDKSRILFQSICSTLVGQKLRKSGLEVQSFDRRRDVFAAYFASLFYYLYDEEERDTFPNRRLITAFIPALINDAGSLARFRADYPDGWLISIMREPSNWLASATPHFNDRADVVIHSWMSSTRAAINEAEKRTILVDYRSLVTDTEAVMRAICERIGIDWHPCLLEPTFLGAPQMPNSSFEVSRTGIIGEAAERVGPDLPQALQDECRALYAEALELAEVRRRRAEARS